MLGAAIVAIPPGFRTDTEVAEEVEVGASTAAHTTVEGSTLSDDAGKEAVDLELRVAENAAFLGDNFFDGLEALSVSRLGGYGYDSKASN